MSNAPKVSVNLKETKETIQRVVPQPDLSVRDQKDAHTYAEAMKLFLWNHVQAYYPDVAGRHVMNDVIVSLVYDNKALAFKALRVSADDKEFFDALYGTYIRVEGESEDARREFATRCLPVIFFDPFQESNRKTFQESNHRISRAITLAMKGR